MLSDCFKTYRKLLQQIVQMNLFLTVVSGLVEQQPLCILHADKSSQSSENITISVENFGRWLKIQ